MKKTVSIHMSCTINLNLNLNSNLNQCETKVHVHKERKNKDINMMETESVKAVVRECLLQELPMILEEVPAIRKSVIRIFRDRFADRDVTEDRFERLFQELKEGREEWNRKWEEEQEESRKKWEEWNRKWEAEQEESRKKWEEQNKRWEEQNEKWEENSRKWEENSRRLDERSQRWEEKFEAMMLEIRDLHSKHESTIGALGSRWGIAAESSFRDALKDILERHFDIQVLNVNEYDDEGTVFGHPDQVELDLIIKDGELIVCEIKSSMSKSQIYTFERKVRFYERRHGREVDRIIIISPMVRENARAVAVRLGIEVFTYAEDVQL